MFQKYKLLIESIFKGITKGNSTATIADYFEVLRYSFLIIGIILLFFVVVVFSWKLPLYIWKRTTRAVIAEMKKYTTEAKRLMQEEIQKYRQLEKKLRNIKIANVIGITCIYIPIMLPLVLIFIDFIVKVLC